MNRNEFLARWPVENILVEAQDGVRVSARYQFSRAPLRYARVRQRHVSAVPAGMTAMPVAITDLGAKKIGHIRIPRAGLDPMERFGRNQVDELGRPSGLWRYDYEAIILAIQTIRQIHGAVPVAWNLKGAAIISVSDLEWEASYPAIDMQQRYNRLGIAK